MTPADLLRAKAKSWREDAYKIKHSPDLADILPDLEHDWYHVYRAVGQTLDEVADELEQP